MLLNPSPEHYQKDDLPKPLPPFVDGTPTKGGDIRSMSPFVNDAIWRRRRSPPFPAGDCLLRAAKGLWPEMHLGTCFGGKSSVD